MNKDPVSKFLLDNAEKKFQPKQVDGANDWLMTQREAGQGIEEYERARNVKKIDPRGQGTIYLFIVDDSIPEELT